MPRKPCLTRGCLNYADTGSYCPSCRRDRAGAGIDRDGTRGGWRNTRDAALERARHRCRRCGAPATAVHHRDLNRHNNTPANLEALCDHCHVQAHQDARAEHARRIGHR